MGNNAYGRFKDYSRNTLKNMTKDELIELLEIFDEMYKGMVLGRNYTLEELELWHIYY